MTFDPEQTAREAGCWLFGHDPHPSDDFLGGPVPEEAPA